MKALKARFNGSGEKVVQYARQFGVGEAMREFQVKDYIAMLNFLQEEAPGEDFQYAKGGADAYAGPDAFDRFCQAVCRTYSRMESTIEAKNKRIAELEKQLDYYKAKKWRETQPIVQEVLQYCEEG